jgi:hypothetical protein
MCDAVVEINETRIGDHRIRGVGLKDAFDGPDGLVNVPMAEFDEVFLSPSLLFSHCPELGAGDTRGAVHTLHQRQITVVVLHSEPGIVELCDPGDHVGC